MSVSIGRIAAHAGASALIVGCFTAVSAQPQRPEHGAAAPPGAEPALRQGQGSPGPHGPAMAPGAGQVPQQGRPGPRAPATAIAPGGQPPHTGGPQMGAAPHTPGQPRAPSAMPPAMRAPGPARAAPGAQLQTPPEHRAAPLWHGDIGRFRDHDIRIWQTGRWRHGHHDGRMGWWWVIGGVWYFYPAPVYPYPDPFAPPLAGPAPADADYWYYCPAYQQYYPYVATCPGGWQAVPAQP